MELHWDRVSGRDEDGDKIDRWRLIHTSGRIYASVVVPLTDVGYYVINFFSNIAILNGEEDFRYATLETAKLFAYDTVSRHLTEAQLVAIPKEAADTKKKRRWWHS